MLNTDMNLTKKEIAEGWHWCADFDFLLVGPDMMEWDVCRCEDGPNAKCNHEPKP